LLALTKLQIQILYQIVYNIFYIISLAALNSGDGTMKRLYILFLALALVACAPQTIKIVPVDTLVALTMAAMPTNTPIPTRPRQPVTPQASTSTPEYNPAAPGAGCVPANTERQRGLVTRVLDGETFEVAIGNNAYQVRYIGLSAPGIAPVLEWQGPQAIGANERLVGGKTVLLVKDVSNNDETGALLRYVFADNAFVNYELVRQGYAKAQSMPPNLACDSMFLGAQVQAQASLLGVWIPTPIPTATITLTPTRGPKPTATLFPACKCSDRLSCKTFRNQPEAQACLNYCVAQGATYLIPILDKNHNGIACDGLIK
jgi:micrococcal nuclease